MNAAKSNDPVWGEWLRVEQASAYCGLKTSYLHVLMCSQALPSRKLGKSKGSPVLIKRTDLDEYIVTHSTLRSID
jgi:hypothetical protein